MANINEELRQIREEADGETVRSAIAVAAQKITDELEGSDDA